MVPSEGAGGTQVSFTFTLTPGLRVRPVLQHQHWLFLFPAVFSQHPVLTVGRVVEEGGGSRSPKGRRVVKVGGRLGSVLVSGLSA